MKTKNLKDKYFKIKEISYINLICRSMEIYLTKEFEIEIFDEEFEIKKLNTL